MRYAVISDIHANLEALLASLKEIDRLKPDTIICLGDVVGYNPNPNECIDIVKERNILCVMGNHDSRIAGVEDAADFNFVAVKAIEWTKSVLVPDNAAFLKSLPRTRFVDNRFLAVHGWINDTDRYIFGAKDAVENFRLLGELKKKTSLCFFGHTHVPAAYMESGTDVEPIDGATIKLEKGRRYLINPGAIGQPRDRNPKASFVLYDSDSSRVTYHRVEYDVQATADKIISAGLPERLAERLKLGW